MSSIAATPPTPWRGLAIAAVGASLAGGGLLAAALTPAGAVWVPRALDWLLFALVAACGLAAAIIDAREHRIPNAIVLPLYVSVSLLVFAGAIATGDVGRLVTAAVAGAIAYLAFLGLGVAGGVGFGDVKLAGGLGIYLGWLSWSAPLVAVVLAFLLAAPHAVVILVRRRRAGLKHRLPFGPYLVAGALLTAAGALLLEL